MVIAVQTEFRSASGDPYLGFLQEAIILLASQFPQHHFYLLQMQKDAAVASPNIKYITTGLPAQGGWWYPLKLRNLLKKIKADVLLTPYAMSSFAGLPHCLLVSHLPEVHEPGLWQFAMQWFQKLKMKRSFRKAAFIATASRFLKRELIRLYQVPADKIEVVPPALPSFFNPQPEEQSEKIREKYTGGAAYFLYMGTVHPDENLVPLLKAFSVFKKRQKSSMKLVLCGPYPEKNNLLRQQLATYRHRQDVVVTGAVPDEEAAALLGAAYALADPSPTRHQLLKAMHCKVPVLAADTEERKELGSTAALYVNPLDVSQTAEQLMLLYKDEALRTRLLEAAYVQVQQFKLEYTARQLWTCIIRTVKNETFTFAPQIQ